MRKVFDFHGACLNHTKRSMCSWAHSHGKQWWGFPYWPLDKSSFVLLMNMIDLWVIVIYWLIYLFVNMKNNNHNNEVCPFMECVAQMLRNVPNREREREKTKCRAFIQWWFDMSALFGGATQNRNWGGRECFLLFIIVIVIVMLLLLFDTIRMQYIIYYIIIIILFIFLSILWVLLSLSLIIKNFW